MDFFNLVFLFLSALSEGDGRIESCIYDRGATASQEHTK